MEQVIKFCVSPKIPEQLRPLKELAYNFTGHQQELEFEDKLVGCTKWFDGSILDIIKKVKGLE